MDMDRHEELLTAVDILLDVHAEWQQTDNPELSADLCQRIEDAIAVWTGGDMPGDLLDLYSKMMALNETWTSTVMQADDLEHIQTARAGSFWKSLDVIRIIREKADEEDTADFRPLESVAALTAQKVGDQQICWIYRARWPEGGKTGPGLWDQRKNRPLLDLLERERLMPGSVIDKDFKPWWVAAKKDANKARKAAAERGAAVQQDRITKLAKPCPETLRELVEQGVDLTQIARMKRTTKEAIRKQCVDEGLPVPPESSDPLRSDYAPDLNESQERIEKAEKPMPAKRKQTVPPLTADEFGGDIDDDQDEEGEQGPAGLDKEADEPLTLPERLVAKWMHTGQADARDIAKAINSEGGLGDDGPIRAGDVKRIMGQLKGDPERLVAALAE